MVDIQDLPKTVADWLSCLGLDGFAAMTPVGHIHSIFGPEIWIDGTGVQWSRDAYIAKWGVDPAIGWKAVKQYRKEQGKTDEIMRL